MPRLAILRHQLGVPSESFILEQASSFQTWEPLLIGRDDINHLPPTVRGLPAVTIEQTSGANGRRLYTAGLGSGILRAILRDNKVDAVLAHFGVEGTYALPAAAALGLPLTTIFHGFDATVSRRGLLLSRRPSWIHYAARRTALARSGQRFLAVSEHIRELLLDQGFPSHLTTTQHTGIDLSKIPAEPIQQVPRSIVHVGRLVPKKGHSILLDALRRLPADVTLTCVGSGPQLAELTAMTRRFGLAERVKFTGALANEATMTHIGQASVLCLPSVTALNGDQEGLGQVLLEAGLLARPVVATRHGGIPSAVLDGETGTLVRERDPDELATALAKFLDDPAFARRVGYRGREHVRKNFDIIRQTGRLETLLTESLAQ